MATKHIRSGQFAMARRKASGQFRVRGERIPQLGPDVMMFRVSSTGGRFVALNHRKADQAKVVVPKIARALNRPGLEKKAVFRRFGSGTVFAYFVYDKDPTKVVRETSTGKRLIGRLVSGKFKAA